MSFRIISTTAVAAASVAAILALAGPAAANIVRGTDRQTVELEGGGTMVVVDTDGDHRVDGYYLYLAGEDQPVLMLYDGNGDQRIDSWWFDRNRDGHTAPGESGYWPAGMGILPLGDFAPEFVLPKGPSILVSDGGTDGRIERVMVVWDFGGRSLEILSDRNGNGWLDRRTVVDGPRLGGHPIQEPDFTL
jgi:hypothetical protein